jgi:hypothetical protein
MALIVNAAISPGVNQARSIAATGVPGRFSADGLVASFVEGTDRTPSKKISFAPVAQLRREFLKEKNGSQLQT